MSVLYTFHLSSPIPDASLTAQTTQTKHMLTQCFACIILTMLKKVWHARIYALQYQCHQPYTTLLKSIHPTIICLTCMWMKIIAITDDSCFMDRAFGGMALLLVSTSQGGKKKPHGMYYNSKPG